MVTIVNFYFNQSEIETKFCINKDQPELGCKGHCYLKKKLSKTIQNDLAPVGIAKTSIFWAHAFEKLVIVDIKPCLIDDQFYSKEEDFYNLLLSKRDIDPPEV